MCDICKAQKLDSRFINGKKYRLYSRTLHTIFQNKITPIKLCFIHDIELFTFGEKRFVQFYPKFVIKVLNSGVRGKVRNNFEDELSNIASLI